MVAAKHPEDWAKLVLTPIGHLQPGEDEERWKPLAEAAHARAIDRMQVSGKQVAVDKLRGGEVCPGLDELPFYLH
eukprot:2152377-Karenia_brevis.AAC.1